jgi:hypothetical protein
VAFDDYSPARHRDDDNMTELDADQIERRQANLRYLLNQWDPVGVADLVPDEYDCLLAPLWTRLTQGASRAEISELLWYDLEDHFHLSPEGHDVDGFADRLIAWAANWSSGS